MLKAPFSAKRVKGVARSAGGFEIYMGTTIKEMVMEMGIFGIIIGIIAILAILGGGHFYIGRRIFQILAFILPGINKFLFTGIFVILPLAMILQFMPLPSVIKSVTRWIGTGWMGFFIYLLMLFAVADLILLIGEISKIIPRPLPADIRFYSNLIVIFITACIVFFGAFNAGRHKIAEYEIKLDGANDSITQELKIVLIADLHLGGTNGERRLEKIVNDINKLNPDIVCIAGDIFNDDYSAIRDPEKAAGLFRSIDAEHGVYAVLGNHDAGRSLNEFTAFLEGGNIKLLNDEYVIIDNRLILAGRLEGSPIGGFENIRRMDAEDFRELIAGAKSANPGLPVILMDHNPLHIGEYKEYSEESGAKIDLILAGHTHRGQIFPGGFITRLMYETDYGYYRRDENSPQVIVTQGVSPWGMPLRVGTSNEIVGITVR